MKPSGKVVVIGAGNVGTSIAYALLNQSVTNRIQILDIAQDLESAQVLDLKHAASFTNFCSVSEGDYSKLEDGDIVVITAGAAQKDDQTRLDLLNINIKILQSILDEIKNTQKQVYVILVTNPVDVLTHFATQELDHLPKGLVFGSGTHLDSGRLRTVIGEEIGTNPRNVHSYILGEHGDSSFPFLSRSTVGGVLLNEVIELNHEKREELMQKVRQAAYEVIKGKGATYLGIGAAIADICRSILRGEGRIFPLSVELENYLGFTDVSISIPVRLDQDGYHIDREVRFDEPEMQLFSNSVNILKESISQIV